MKWIASLLVVAAVTGLGAVAEPSIAAAAGPTCKGGSINIGAVSTITGPADFSEVPKAAKAVFDQVNAAGGINGCKINYTIEDDKADPQVAAQAARDLVDNKDVVALVGSASLLDCAVNGATYNRAGVLSVQGLGVDPACYHSPSIAPVNVGPYTLTTIMGDFATKHLKSKKFCAFFIIIGGTQEAYKQGIHDWEKLTGQKVHLLDLTLPLSGDLTSYVIKARDAGCDAVLTNAVEPGVVQWMKTVDDQKITGVNWLFLAPGYTLQVAKALANSNQPIYVGTEWEPYTETGSQANAQWIATMNKANRPLTAFSQGGYESAEIFLDVLKTINGEVTRASVTKALHTMKPIHFPLSGTPYIFGEAKAHAPEHAGKVMRLVHGKWQVETPQWIVVPPVM